MRYNPNAPHIQTPYDVPRSDRGFFAYDTPVIPAYPANPPELGLSTQVGVAAFPPQPEYAPQLPLLSSGSPELQATEAAMASQIEDVYQRSGQAEPLTVADIIGEDPQAELALAGVKRKHKIYDSAFDNGDDDDDYSGPSTTPAITNTPSGPMEPPSPASGGSSNRGNGGSHTGGSGRSGGSSGDSGDAGGNPPTGGLPEQGDNSDDDLDEHGFPKGLKSEQLEEFRKQLIAAVEYASEMSQVSVTMLQVALKTDEIRSIELIQALSKRGLIQYNPERYLYPCLIREDTQRAAAIHGINAATAQIIQPPLPEKLPEAPVDPQQSPEGLSIMGSMREDPPFVTSEEYTPVTRKSSYTKRGLDRPGAGPATRLYKHVISGEIIAVPDNDSRALDAIEHYINRQIEPDTVANADLEAYYEQLISPAPKSIIASAVGHLAAHLHRSDTEGVVLSIDDELNEPANETIVVSNATEEESFKQQAEALMKTFNTEKLGDPFDAVDYEAAANFVRTRDNFDVALVSFKLRICEQQGWEERRVDDQLTYFDSQGIVISDDNSELKILQELAHTQREINEQAKHATLVYFAPALGGYEAINNEWSRLLRLVEAARDGDPALYNEWERNYFTDIRESISIDVLNGVLSSASSMKTEFDENHKLVLLNAEGDNLTGSAFDNTAQLILAANEIITHVPEKVPDQLRNVFATHPGLAVYNSDQILQALRRSKVGKDEYEEALNTIGSGTTSSVFVSPQGAYIVVDNLRIQADPQYVKEIRGQLTYMAQTHSVVYDVEIDDKLLKFPADAKTPVTATLRDLDKSDRFGIWRDRVYLRGITDKPETLRTPRSDAEKRRLRQRRTKRAVGILVAATVVIIPMASNNDGAEHRVEAQPTVSAPAHSGSETPATSGSSAATPHASPSVTSPSATPSAELPEVRLTPTHLAPQPKPTVTHPSEGATSSNHSKAPNQTPDKNQSATPHTVQTIDGPIMVKYDTVSHEAAGVIAKDGTVWSMATTMLHAAGIAHPTNTAVYTLTGEILAKGGSDWAHAPQDVHPGSTATVTIGQNGTPHIVDVKLR